MTLRARLIEAAEAAHRRGEHRRHVQPRCPLCCPPVHLVRRALPAKDMTGMAA